MRYRYTHIHFLQYTSFYGIQGWQSLVNVRIAEWQLDLDNLCIEMTKEKNFYYHDNYLEFLFKYKTFSSVCSEFW